MRKSGFSAEQIVAIRQRAMTPATKSVASSSAIPAPVADSPMTKLVDQVVGAVRFYVGARIDTDLARVQNELRGLAESMGTDDAVTGAAIAGIHSVAIQRDEHGDPEADILMLELRLSDGSIAATWWPLQDMARFCSRVGMDVRRPATSPLQ
jgi:hypothetical protein